jgi:tetratricopeptide (TPR) repeat protein
MEVVNKLARPANATPEQWQRTRKQVEAMARLALALTAMMLEDYAMAETEYAAAFKLMEIPDALSLYRLGLTYSFQKKYDDAIAALQRAVEAGGVRGRSAGGEPRELAAEALAYVEKQKAAAAPKPETESAPTAEDTEAGREKASGESPAQ